MTTAIFRHPPRPGMVVFARDHVRLGHVADVASNHIIVEEGLLLPHERYVPLRAIARWTTRTASSFT